MPNVRQTPATQTAPSTLLLKLEEETRTGARIKVVGVGGAGARVRLAYMTAPTAVA